MYRMTTQLTLKQYFEIPTRNDHNDNDSSNNNDKNNDNNTTNKNDNNDRENNNDKNNDNDYQKLHYKDCKQNL